MYISLPHHVAKFVARDLSRKHVTILWTGSVVVEIHVDLACEPTSDRSYGWVTVASENVLDSPVVVACELNVPVQSEVV